MTRLTWERRDVETGLDRGVYFPQDSPAEAWNGLIAVDETPSDEDAQTRYIDGIKTRHHRRPGEFSGQIEAFTYPDDLDDVIFTRRKPSFGFSYRIGKPVGHLIHLVYNATISPGGFSWDQSEISTFKWKFTTRPETIPGGYPSAHVIVDTTKAYSTTLEDFENVIYGDDSHAAYLPSPTEVLEIFEVNSIVRVIDHGDGTYSVTGPDDVIQMLDSTSYSINWPSAVMLDADTYTISSL